MHLLTWRWEYPCSQGRSWVCSWQQAVCIWFPDCSGVGGNEWSVDADSERGRRLPAAAASTSAQYPVHHGLLAGPRRHRIEARGRGLRMGGDRTGISCMSTAHWTATPRHLNRLASTPAIPVYRRRMRIITMLSRMVCPGSCGSLCLALFAIASRGRAVSGYCGIAAGGDCTPSHFYRDTTMDQIAWWRA